MIAVKPISEFLQSNSPFKKVGYIGLDFALEKINFVQLGKLSNGELALKSVCSLPYDGSRKELLSSPKLLRAKLRKAFAGTNFAGKKIVSSIPSHDVRIISVNYHNTNNANSSSAIIQAIKERIDDDLANYVIDYMPVRANDLEKEQLAIVALVKQEVVNSYLEGLRYAGLNVEALEIRPAAINRYVYSNLEKDDYQNILSVNLGDKNSYLTVTSGRRLLFDQQVDFGSVKLIERISDALDISKDSVIQLVEKYGFEDARSEVSAKLVYPEDYSKTLQEICKPELDKLTDEINRALLFAASENHGQTINKVYLLGSMSYWSGFDSYLEKKLKVDTETVRNPLNGLPDPCHCLDGYRFSNTPELSIAIGHALRGLI